MFMEYYVFSLVEYFILLYYKYIISDLLQSKILIFEVSHDIQSSNLQSLAPIKLL